MTSASAPFHAFLSWSFGSYQFHQLSILPPNQLQFLPHRYELSSELGKSSLSLFPSNWQLSLKILFYWVDCFCAHLIASFYIPHHLLEFVHPIPARLIWTFSLDIFRTGRSWKLNFFWVTELLYYLAQKLLFWTWLCLHCCWRVGTA